MIVAWALLAVLGVFTAAAGGYAGFILYLYIRDGAEDIEEPIE